MAEAMGIYAKRQHLSQQAIGYARDIQISALTQIGQMLAVMPKAKGTRGQLKGSTLSGDTQLAAPETGGPPTLADLGLTLKQSALAQKLAKLPAKQLELVKAGLASTTKAIREVVHAQRPPLVVPEERATPRKIR